MSTVLTPEALDLRGKQAAVAAQLTATLRAGGRLGVAYSGGVDSAVLLALAARALGPARVVAIMGISQSLASRERQAAQRVAAEIGVEVIDIVTSELESSDYRRNGVDRCYHCKDELFSRIDETLAAYDLGAVAFGENADDRARRDRPGATAASEHGVLRPLADAGLSKADVRAVARELGLSVAEKPAAPCLASRIPHGEEVTAEKLAQVEAAEDALFALGFRECRVRHHGATARIELPAPDIGRLVDPEIREQVLAGVRAAGFANVTVDLAGLQSGAFTMNLLGLPAVGEPHVTG